MANLNSISPAQCKLLLKYTGDILAVSRASDVNLTQLVGKDPKGCFGQINGRTVYQISLKKLEKIKNTEVFDTVMLVVSAICVLVTPFFLPVLLFAGFAISLVCIHAFFAARKYKRKLASNLAIEIQHKIKDGIFPKIEQFSTSVVNYEPTPESRKYYGELLCDIITNKKTEATQQLITSHKNN